MRLRPLATITAVFAVLIMVLNACAPQRNMLEQVQASGELEILTRNSPTTYFYGPHGPSGLEYDLAKAFAEYLGVKLVVNTQDSLKKILTAIQEGDAHIAAAGLTVTAERQKLVRFTPPYQYITQQLVYRSGSLKPRDIRDTLDGHLEVIAHSSHVEQLKKIKHQVTDLTWDETNVAGSTELMNLVAKELIDYTIADSNEVALNRRYHPELRVAFDLSEPEALAWAMRQSEDDSLYNEAVSFFKTIKENGELKRLLRQHYGHVRNYDYAGTPTYMRHIMNRMPQYLTMFEQAAKDNDLDWRLLAAVAYQESHWNPLAVSPTGVRGIMMLTKVTAKQLGVDKRTDPQQSIYGGARYLRNMIGRLAEIPEPDRTWMALASYNVGLGHVRDAQWITEQRGGDPKKWSDVKQSLPLLLQRKWYRQTRYGYARGKEPVKYVENIRSYYDILRWQTGEKKPQPIPKSILAFTSPVL